MSPKEPGGGRSNAVRPGGEAGSLPAARELRARKSRSGRRNDPRGGRTKPLAAAAAVATAAVAAVVAVALGVASVCVDSSGNHGSLVGAVVAIYDLVTDGIFIATLSQA